jgi:DNA mismatch repair protein MutS2
MIHPEAVLGFDRVRRLLKAETSTEKAGDRADNLRSFQAPETFRKTQDLILEMRDLIALDTAIPLSGFSDQTRIFKRAAVQGTALSGEELFTLGSILQTSRKIREYFKNRPEKYPLLRKRVLDPTVDLHPLEQDILSVLDESGAVVDHASPELHAIRKKISRLNQRIFQEIQKISAKLVEDQVAVSDQVSFRNGRHVIPVRASRKHQIEGIIHDQSQTGQTFYVEPLTIVVMNNDLREAQLAEKEEIHRILQALTDRVREHLGDFQVATNMLEDLDFIHAAGKIAVRYACDKPSEETDTFRIVNGRNLELAVQRDVVPLTFSLEKGKRGIIITGPNAGGKTVTLKTVGLLALMNQAGLLIPADASSTLPIFDRIFVDIGDEQSIEGDLSTFSSHILRIRTILEQATHESLVLIDELGTGTDPDEGAALAEGILRELMHRGTMTFATTHHSALKTLAFEIDDLENGSMMFDDKSLSPTYEFRLGIPGSSYAIEIARRYHLDPRVIETAVMRVGKSREKLERLIQDLQRKIFRYDTLLKDIRKREEHLKQDTEHIQERLKTIDTKYKKAEREALKRAELIITDLQKELESTIREIRETGAESAAIHKAKQTFTEVKAKVQIRQEKTADPQKSILKMNALNVGDEVWIRSLEQNGRIVEINPRKHRVWVDVDGSRMRLDLSWLDKARKSTQRVETHVERSADIVSHRIDLRGFRTEEALSSLDRFIDRAVVSRLSQVEVLHGTGYGILKKFIEEFLTKDRRVLSFEEAPWDQGGAGITLVKLNI